MTSHVQIRLRRGIGFLGIALLLGIDVYATGLFGGSERALAVVRSIVLPGLPFLEWNLLYGAVAIVAALAAIGAWLRWGIDWLPALVMSICVGIAVFVMPLHHHHEAVESVSHHVLESSHEFTVVLVVFALLARLRLMFDRLPGSGWIKRQLPAGMFFPAVDIARTAVLSLLTSPRDDAASTALADPRLSARASRVNRWARMRGGDPYQLAHAPLRAAMALGGMFDATQLARFRTDARAQHAGVPPSEPTWIRPLDGMLAALGAAIVGRSGLRRTMAIDVRIALHPFARTQSCRITRTDDVEHRYGSVVGTRGCDRTGTLCGLARRRGLEDTCDGIASVELQAARAINRRCV